MDVPSSNNTLMMRRPHLNLPIHSDGPACLFPRQVGVVACWIFATSLAQAASDSAAGEDGPNSVSLTGLGIIALGLFAVAAACRAWLNSSTIRQNPFHQLKPGHFSSARKPAPETSLSDSAPTHSEARSTADRVLPIAALPQPGDGFVYSAAHDLQEPLRKLKSQIHRLESKVSALELNPLVDDLKQMQRTATRMQNLLDSLLSLAGIQGRGTRFQPVDVAVLWDEVLSNLEPRISETSASIVLEGTFPELEGDPVQLGQLLQNLLSNGLKFQRVGTRPEIVVSARSLQVEVESTEKAGPPQTWCELRIRDNGIGFDSSEWEKLLRGFHRQNDRAQFDGTGLGLAICRSIVERHAGKLSAVSSPGKGSTIIVQIPCHHHARGGDTSLIRPGQSRSELSLPSPGLSERLP